MLALDELTSPKPQRRRIRQLVLEDESGGLSRFNNAHIPCGPSASMTVQQDARVVLPIYLYALYYFQGVRLLNPVAIRHFPNPTLIPRVLLQLLQLRLPASYHLDLVDHQKNPGDCSTSGMYAVVQNRVSFSG